jgi:hypothetical protein
MSVDPISTGESQVYRIHAAFAGDVPLAGWPHEPQPLPEPGFELAGVVDSLTRSGFSHGALPLVVIVASEPNSADVGFSVSSTSTSRWVVSSPSDAVSRNT